VRLALKSVWYNNEGFNMEKQKSPIQLKSEYLVVYENIIALNISCQLVFIMQRKTTHPVQMYINMPNARSVIYLPSNNKEAHLLYQEYTELFVDLFETQGPGALETKLSSLRQEVYQGKKIQFDTFINQGIPQDKDA
jgi:hypothetical protein